MAVVLKVWIVLGYLVISCGGTPTNIYDALQPYGCGQFLAILNKCGYYVRNQYKENVRWTVFAPNDTAFDNMPPAKRSALLSMTEAESEVFVMSFTLPKEVRTTYYPEAEPQQSRSPRTTYIFLTKRVRKAGNTASGVAGPTEYYANGAMILRPNLQAGQSVIHVIDRVLEVPSDKSVLGYISLEGQLDTAFYTMILNLLLGKSREDAVEPLNSYRKLTALIPTKEALAKIPSDKMQILRSNPEKLKEVALLHTIPDHVMYTSFVYHNEGINNLGKGQVIFRTNTAREAVFVNSGGVTAEVTHGNITCTNGAVHMIDTLLGYIYNSAREEIEISPLTRTFNELLQQARNELHQIIVSPSGVTLFVPVNDAFTNLPEFYNLYRNQSLINKVIELSLLEHGQEYPVTTVNGDYESRQSLTVQYFGRRLHIYSQGNETWIESGYVKARVVRPDVGVTNGFVHFIDAVPGVPNRDVPNTIFCEDWLIKSSLQLTMTGLNDYMRDTRLRSLAPCTTGGGVRSSPDVYSNNYYGQSGSGPSGGMPVCRGNCYFTVFIPNGTAVDFFENMAGGRYIQNNPDRWRYVLARHITRDVIYLDQTAIGQEKSFRALNGNEVRYRRATATYAYLYYQGKMAQVIHSDLGGTNGVVHIINQVIFVTDDLYRDNLDWNLSGTSAAASHFVPAFCLCVSVIHVIWRWFCLQECG